MFTSRSTCVPPLVQLLLIAVTNNSAISAEMLFIVLYCTVLYELVLALYTLARSLKRAKMG